MTLASALVGAGVLPPDHLHQSDPAHSDRIHAHWEFTTHLEAPASVSAHGGPRRRRNARPCDGCGTGTARSWSAGGAAAACLGRRGHVRRNPMRRPRDSDGPSPTARDPRRRAHRPPDSPSCPFLPRSVAVLCVWRRMRQFLYPCIAVFCMGFAQPVAAQQPLTETDAVSRVPWRVPGPALSAPRLTSRAPTPTRPPGGRTRV